MCQNHAILSDIRSGAGRYNAKDGRQSSQTEKSAKREPHRNAEANVAVL